MPVDQETQELFVEEIARKYNGKMGIYKHRTLVDIIPERLLTINRSDNEFRRDHYGYHPDLYKPNVPHLGHFRERVSLTIGFPLREPINGFFIQNDESKNALDSNRYLEVSVGRNYSIDDSFFGYVLVLNQREFNFYFNSNGDLVDFYFGKFMSTFEVAETGTGYLIVSSSWNKDQLCELNRMVPLEISRGPYQYLLNQTPEDLTVSRIKKGRLLDRISIHRPNISSTGILEQIIPQRLLDNPCSTDPELDIIGAWRIGYH